MSPLSSGDLQASSQGSRFIMACAIHAWVAWGVASEAGASSTAGPAEGSHGTKKGQRGARESIINAETYAHS